MQIPHSCAAIILPAPCETKRCCTCCAPLNSIVCTAKHLTFQLWAATCLLHLLVGDEPDQKGGEGAADEQVVIVLGQTKLIGAGLAWTFLALQAWVVVERSTG